MEIENGDAVLTDDLLNISPVKEGWSITGTEVSFLWTEIWPKLVALGWKNPGKVVGGATKHYRAEFSSKTIFRTREASRVAKLLGLRYQSNIPIHLAQPDSLGISMPYMARVWRPEARQSGPAANPDSKPFMGRLSRREARPSGPVANPDSNGSGSGGSAFCLGNMYGETFFVISEDGIFMPWPDAPTVPEILMGYIQGGGVLPRRGAPVKPLIPRAPTLQSMENFPTDIGGNNFPGKIRSVITGVSVMTLLEKWQNMVALAWEDGPTRIAEMIAEPKKYVAPEVWSTWPKSVDVLVLKDTPDFVISHDPKSKIPLRIDVPIPEQPLNADDYFEELIIGHASNPMYSNCY